MPNLLNILNFIFNKEPITKLGKQIFPELLTGDLLLTLGYHKKYTLTHLFSFTILLALSECPHLTPFTGPIWVTLLSRDPFNSVSRCEDTTLS